MLDKCDAAWRMTQNCTADALKRHERVNAFNLALVYLFLRFFRRRIKKRIAVCNQIIPIKSRSDFVGRYI